MGLKCGVFAACLHIFSRRRRLQRKQASIVCDFLQTIWKRISIYKCLVKLSQKGFCGGFEASFEEEGMEEARKEMKEKRKDKDEATLREQSTHRVPSARRAFNRLNSWSHYVEGSIGCELSALEVESAVDLSQLFLGQKFASGAYSRLYHGIYKNRAVAVKLIAPPEEDRQLSSRLDRQFSQEVALLSHLQHCNVIEFVGACKKPPIYCVITEYLPGGSLMAFLHKSKPYSLPMKVVTRIALDVARGMEYLHSQGVIHRDLKSDNLLMTDDFHIKIADFGVSCLETHRENMKGFMGTYRWMAPEMIEEKTCSRKVDVYSFGIVLWELCTGLIPFGEMTPVQAAFAICQERARPSIPAHCSEEIAKLMQLCWCSNPTKRPEFSQIVQILQSFNEV